MIIYTTVPLEKVFEGIEETQRLKEIEVNGLTMLVEQLAPNEGKIVRMISSNPNDYLKTQYNPGQKVFFRPEIHQ